jgi:hypothetical protein
MKGQIVSANVTGFVSREALRVAALLSVNGQPGILHRRDAIGTTREERAATLDLLCEGTVVDVEVTGNASVQGAPGFRVSQFAAARTKWLAQVQPWIAESRIFKASVTRVESDKGYAILDLGNEVQALMHFSKVAGTTDDERLSRLSGLQVGDCLPVVVTEPRRPGRVRVAESV